MPKIVDHDQYRKELLGKCFELFAEKGYAAIAMRQIAEGLGVSTGTLYHYFPSKESLFEQLVEYLSYQDTSEETLADLGNPQSLAERIDALFNFVAKNQNYFLKQNFIMIDFYRQQEDKDFYRSPTWDRIRKQYLSIAAQYLQIQDEVLVDFVLIFLNGLILERVFDESHNSSDEMAAILKKMLTLYLENKISVDME